jgi:amidase
LFAERASAEVNAHLGAVAESLRSEGATIEDVEPPAAAGSIHEAGATVLRVEAAAYHAEMFAVHGGSYRPRIRALVEAGLPVPAVAYVEAQRVRERFREEVRPLLEAFDALLMPVAPTPAPRGLDSTGDPVLCAPWSFGGFPAIALPSGLTDGGLPLAIQLVAGARQEERLLDVARWCEGRLKFTLEPPLRSD